MNRSTEGAENRARGQRPPSNCERGQVVTSPRQLLTIIAAVTLAACGGGATTQAPAPTAPAPTAPGPTAPAATAPGPIYTRPGPTARPDYVLVAVGDSIPFNSTEDCPGCAGFVTQYGAALATESGRTVGASNLSQHSGLTVPELLRELGDDKSRIAALTDADAIIVGIAHNDVPMNLSDDACDGENGDSPDWSKYTDKCIAAEVKRFTPIYESVYSKIAALRAGKPTILRTINRYNDWNGWPGHELSAAGLDATRRVIAAWNKMICGAAEKSGFVCADISAAFNGEDGTKPSGDLLGSDYTHPSQKGNDVIFAVLRPLGFAPLVQ